MKDIVTRLIATTAIALALGAASAQEPAPYGAASSTPQSYGPLKYVIESSALEPAEVANTLRVAKQVMSLSPKGSEMTVVIIGPGIRVFARENYEKFQPIVEAAAELRDAGVRIAYCGSSMAGAGFKPADLHGLGPVVPGGYVEVAGLVAKGYAHIRPPAVLARTRDARYLDRPEPRK
jgi:intracellular sulfur oxidation DsrE/DsrF family protein